MRVTLIGKKSLYKVDLPRIPIGNYWLTDKTTEKERKLINIEGKDGNWKIITNGIVNVINPKALDITGDKIRLRQDINIVYSESLILKEHCMYAIKFGKTNDIYILYCSPIYDKNFEHLSVKKDFYIGKNQKCQIKYDNVLVSDVHARIFRMSGRWVLENLDKKVGTFVNGIRVEENEKILQNGDVIYIIGLKIVILENSIFINNPLNEVSYNGEFFKKIIQRQKIDVNDLKTEDYYEDVELYNEKDYFSRAPRIINMIEEKKVKIDAPPQLQDQEDMPTFLVLGSSLSMGLMMVISIVMTIDGRMSGTATAKDTTFSILMALTMLISMILFPVLTQKWEKKKKIKYEQKRQKKYKEYLEKKRRLIAQIKESQKKILFQNYGSVEDCVKIIIEKNSHLWERKIENYDFLHIRLGIGDVPLKINLQVPDEQFSMEDDNLMEILNKIIEESKIIKSAPIVTSLVEKDISALIIRNYEVFEKMMQSIIIQLIALHSYEDLKLVFLIKKENESYWEYVKMLPHVWDNAKDIRFFADNPDDMREISNYLEQILKNRQAYDNDSIDYKSFSPYYLIITDDYERIKNLRIINEVLSNKKNLGFSLLCITRDLAQLPNECKSFISLEEKRGIIFDNQIVENNQREIEIDISYTIFFDKIVQTISNIPIRYSTSGAMLLPSMYTFLEMYDVGLIEQLNILERWKKNDSTISLRAPIGIDVSGMPIVLDIHEKAHGPHGLIAGSTGSGKSELIITYILSLAVNYHPDDVSFLLIDYKGGGLAGAFQKNDIKLPHLVGKITNIDTNGLQRSLASIQSELRRRQIIFDKARNMIDEGVMDIYKYQKLYHEGILKTPVPHLLIICDEFAELKQQQEEFMDGLISVSRIGRSLGVHLILATQKPAGIVNDQIRSNSKFAICLKVQDREDSNDVIKRPDAASLRGSGQFFMQVGNDDYFVLGQSAWAGAQYYPSSIIKKKIDNSINFVSNVGVSLKDVDNIAQKNISNQGEQLTNIVRYMSELAKKEHIKTHNLWLDEIPENIYIDKIKKKYQVKNEQEGLISCVIGEYDDPYNQKQGIVQIDFSNDGNTIIYGNAESGKETLLSTITYDLMQTYSSENLWIYILDFGSEALKIFKDSAHVGDVVFVGENEKLRRFFDMIQKEIKDRKNILSNYNGNYNLYVKTAKEKMPMILVILNNYEAFAENYENEYDDAFLSITRECVKCGIVFTITANSFNDLRYRLSQNFRKKIALQINNEDDYFNIFDKVGKKRPSHIFGRGLVSLENDEVYEFQTAKICNGADYNIKVKEKINELNSKNNVQASTIPVMPDKITIEDIKEYIKDINSIPIGINQKDLRLIEYNFRKNFITIMTSKNADDLIEYIEFILEIFKNVDSLNVVIFDAERNLISKKEDLKEQFQKLTLIIENELVNIVNPYSICIINGLDKFLSEIEDEEYFYQTLRKAEESGKYSFIIMENVNKLKNHEYESWYKNYVAGDSGIYIGNGIDDQFAISISDRKGIVNNCGRSFGYVIKNGNPVLIKLVGLRETGDENE